MASTVYQFLPRGTSGAGAAAARARRTGPEAPVVGANCTPSSTPHDRIQGLMDSARHVIGCR